MTVAVKIALFPPKVWTVPTYQCNSCHAFAMGKPIAMVMDRHEQLLPEDEIYRLASRFVDDANCMPHKWTAVDTCHYCADCTKETL